MLKKLNTLRKFPLLEVYLGFFTNVYNYCFSYLFLFSFAIKVV